MKRLFELEVPEIHDGVVKSNRWPEKLAPVPNYRCIPMMKNVDCIGACIGAKGARVQAIVDELRGEKLILSNG